jgi:FlaA1/EpsC-like NDP-sugar epimerase
MHKALTLFNSIRTILLLAIYGLVLSASFYLAYDLRFDFAVPVDAQFDRNHYLVGILLVKLALLVPFRQYGSLLTFFSVPDLLRIVGAMLVGGLGFTILWYVTSGQLAPPRGVLLADFVLSVAGLSGCRLLLRIYRERFSIHSNISGGDGGRIKLRRIVIFGAGDVGARLAQEVTSRPHLGLRPICFLDDDRSKHGMLIHGVTVKGAPEEIAKIAARRKIDSAVIAMPSVSGRRMREIVHLATEARLSVEIVPSINELAAGRMRANRIRPVEVQDLLGREAVNLDSASIRKLIEDRVVMVTGAGGSIGSELCRQIAGLNPKRLLMVEQAEGNLFAAMQEIDELGLGAIALPLVADIADSERMESIFSRYEPEVVFHAAAHKHVFMMERQPAEAIANNVLGTRRLALIAARHRVGTFVLISTDKAINPTSVMGATKRLAEIQVLAIQAAQGDGGGKFMAVRFGNVLGSSGSVVPIFKRQIARGGPVTITHPDVTRYFMTIPEAVGLVLQSAVLGRGGEIFVLDMGQPVKIADLARQMIVLSGFKPEEDIEIKIVGLRPGEKLFEELRYGTEKHLPTIHPRIMHFVSETALSESGIVELERELFRLEPGELKRILKRMVPEYEPYLD